MNMAFSSNSKDYLKNLKIILQMYRQKQEPGSSFNLIPVSFLLFIELYRTLEIAAQLLDRTLLDP